MSRVSIDEFTSSVQSKLTELDLRIRPLPAAKLIWEERFVEADRIQLGGSFTEAYRGRGTIGMWMAVYGVSPIRALIDSSRSIEVLSPENHRWLLRDTGEADGERLMQSAIESDALVLTDERLSYFRGESIHVNWREHDKSWAFLWELARASKRGRILDHLDLGERATPKTLGDRKHRLKALLPTELFGLILRVRGAGCRVDLPANMIRLFIYDTNDMLMEWAGWEPAAGF